MAIQTKVICDYAGYCGRKVTVEEAIKERWAQVEVTGDVLRISAFDNQKLDVMTACPLHVDDVAQDAVSKLDWFGPQAVEAIRDPE